MKCPKNIICKTVTLSFGLLYLSGLWGCLMPIEEKKLTAKNTHVNSLNRCNSCHAYPPPDINHEYHLFEAFNTTVYNKKITCYDCHGNSIQADSSHVLDTVFKGFFGGEIHSLEFPDDESIRELDIVRIDSFLQEIPRYYTDQDTVENSLLLYMTSGAHNNGKVDVLMHQQDSDSIPRYEAKTLTCYVAACHTSDEPYAIDVGFAEHLLH